jgi:tRNA threonylcarbamoyladenosine modification (KEOPS) complex  Pcc1 subunit
MNKLTLSLTLESKNKKMISAVFKALKPDNVSIPKEISFHFDLVGDKIILITSSEEDFETLISTVREVLNNMGLCIQTLMVKGDGEGKN